jgi:hypothetical protein
VQTHSAAGRHCVSYWTAVRPGRELYCSLENVGDIIFDLKKTELNLDHGNRSYGRLKKVSKNGKYGPIRP